MKLKNKVAIVTGGGKGIGEEICLGLVKEGAKIVIADLDKENSSNVIKAIIQNGGDAIYVETNVSNEQSVKNLISEIKPYDLKNLIEWKVVQGGMIPKIKNCVDAVENGVRGVVILDGRKPHSILHEIFSDQGAGTLIRK